MGQFPCNRNGFLLCLACGLAVLGGLVVIATVSGTAGAPGPGSVCEGLDGVPGDVDGDGFLTADDCDDSNAGLWDSPGEATDLTVRTTSPQGSSHTIEWSLDSAQSGAGSAPVTFTTLRSRDPADFTDPSVVCLGPAETGTSTEDADTPPLNQAFFYLVRPDNECGEGSLGVDSAGLPRTGRACDCSVVCDDGNACTVDSCADGACTNVVAAPEVLSSPTSTATCVGGEARFSVTAQGAGQLGYVWRQNGVVIGNNAPVVVLSSPPVSDNGSTVTVEVSDTCSTTTTAAATLTVFPDPLSCEGGGDGYEATNAASLSSYPYADAPLGTRHKTHGGGAVYLFGGEYHLEQTDLEIPGRGFDFVWNRKYRSRVVLQTSLGPQWDHGYNRFVEPDPAIQGNFLVHDGNTRADSYSPSPTAQGCFERRGLFRELCVGADGLTYTLTFADKHQWVFHPLDGSAEQGKITQSIDRNGNSMSFTYDATGRLTTIVDTLGRPVTVAYNARNQVESVTDFAGRVVTYAYYDGVEPGGNLDDLKSVTTPAVTGTPTGNDFPSGKTTTYTYSTGFADGRLNHNLLTITDPKGQTFLTNVYASTTLPTDGRFDRVDHQIYPDGVVSYAYVARTPGPGDPIVSETYVVDRAGNVSTHAFDDQNRLVRLREHTGRAPDPDLPADGFVNRPQNPLRATDPLFFEHAFEYNVDSLPVRVVRPGGDEWTLVYNDTNPQVRLRGNLLQRTHDPGPSGGTQPAITEFFTYATDFGSSYGRRVEGAADSGGTWRVVRDRGLRIDAVGINESSDDSSDLRLADASHAEMIRIAHQNLSESVGLQPAYGGGMSLGVIRAHRHESIGVRGVMGSELSMDILDRYRNESIGLELALGGRNSYGLVHVNRHASVAQHIRRNSAEDIGLINAVGDNSNSELMYPRHRTNSHAYIGGIGRNSSIGLIEGIRFRQDYGQVRGHRTRRNSVGAMHSVAMARNSIDLDESDDSSASEMMYGAGGTPATASIDDFDVGLMVAGDDSSASDDDMYATSMRSVRRSRSAPAWGRSFPSTYQDGRGQVYVMTHDNSGNVRIVAEPSAVTGTPGGTLQPIRHILNYDAFGQLSEYQNPEGRVDSFVYCDTGPQRGYLCGIVLDEPGEALTTALEYDDVGNLVRVTDPRGNATQLIVNQRNQVVRMVRSAPFLHETDYYYDDNDLLVRVDVQNVDDQGAVASNSHLSSRRVFDLLDRAVRAEVEVGDDGACVVAELEYDANENPTLFRDGEAANGNQPTNTVRTLYDERDLPLLLRRAEGDPQQSTTEYDYDANGNVAQVRYGVEDPVRVRVAEMSYDGYDRMTGLTDPAGNEATRGYDENGNRVSVRIDGELDQGFGLPPVRLYEDARTYDEVDRLVQLDVQHFHLDTQTPVADGVATTKLEYAADSRIVRLEDDNGHAVSVAHDSLRRTREITDAKGNSVVFGYDASGNLASLTRTDVSDTGAPDEVFVTTIDHDELNRRTEQTDNLFQRWTWSYDSRGNLTSTTDPLGNATRYDYDAMSRPVLTERILTDTGDGTGSPVGSVVQTVEYDDSSRIVASTDANGNVTAYGYDPLNRPASRSQDDGVIRTFTWTQVDGPFTFTDGNGTVDSMSHDALGRLTSRTVTRGPGVGGTTTEEFVYDGMGRLRSATNDDTTVTATYDSLSNLREERLQIGTGPVRTTVADRDGVGNALSVTYPSGRVVSTVYDELDRPSSVTSDGNLVAQYDYIGPDRVEQVARPSGVTTVYGYDGLGRLTRKEHVSAVGAVVDVSFGWDGVGNLTSHVDLLQGGRTLELEYDSAYRLVRSRRTVPGLPTDTIDYTLDPAGNRTLVVGGPDAGTYTMDPTLPEPADQQVNQYTATPLGTRLYDRNGNTVQLPGASGAVYDFRNRLIQATDGAGLTHTYTYDPLGRRVQQVEPVSGATVRFYRFGGGIVEEQDGQGVARATYVWGRQPTPVVLHEEQDLDGNQALDVRWYHTDHRSNVLALTDATGAAVERYDYGDFGCLSVTDGLGVPQQAPRFGNLFSFGGMRHDPETGLYWSGSRMLDCTSGRYLMRAGVPIGSSGSTATYGRDNPWSP